MGTKYVNPLSHIAVEGTQKTSMDTMVSTSNHLASDIITLETDKPVFWTAELGKPSST